MSALASGISRAVAGVALGFIVASLIPVYSAPFGGCDATGWLALEPGCAHWPEALRGFLFVAGIALLSTRWFLPILAVIALLIASLHGGIEHIQTGEHLYVNHATSAFLVGYPLVAGGLLALALWVFIMRTFYTRRNYV